MDVHEAIQTRRSVRSYGDTPVPDEALNRILEAARMAPSASNQQNWRFIVVRDDARRRALAQAASGQMWIAQAPVIIAAVATEPRSIMTCGVPRYAVDLAIAIDHMTLAAVTEGLGTCWIGSFDQRKARQVLEVGDECMIVTIMPVGYPSAAAGMKSRKKLEDIVRYETDSR